MEADINMSKIAIYARKSVFREDSISIESQIEMCKFEARGEDFVIYSDNGYSGKNTSRPEYQKMIQDIINKKIHKVIVYKLDRISRSILDFSKMMDLFQIHNVDFISATEHFDTSSPMGRAMLNICIVFAQLERETIQQRVIDAYASRSKKGFYMGGKIPYGYKKVPITMGGVKTSMYEIVPEEAEDIRLIYQMYSSPSATLGDVRRELEKRGINVNRRGRVWSTARLSEVMRNPVYTFADINIYQFFKEQNSCIVNPLEDFNGEVSLYLFSGKNKNRKTWDLSDQNVVVAPHQGIVDSETWLACRKKLLANHQIRTCKPKNSFLSGKIKCGNCGYGLVIRFSKRKNGTVRYFIDTGWTDMHYCTNKLPTIRADEFEDMIVERIKDKIDSLSIKAKTDSRDDEIQKNIYKLQSEIEKINSTIDSLVDTIVAGTADNTTITYINKRITELDLQKNELTNQIDEMNNKKDNNKSNDYEELKNVMSKWNTMEFDDKRAVVNLLIEKILVYPDKIEIMWDV